MLPGTLTFKTLCRRHEEKVSSLSTSYFVQMLTGSGAATNDVPPHPFARRLLPQFAMLTMSNSEPFTMLGLQYVAYSSFSDTNKEEEII